MLSATGGDGRGDGGTRDCEEGKNSKLETGNFGDQSEKKEAHAMRDGRRDDDGEARIRDDGEARIRSVNGTQIQYLCFTKAHCNFGSISNHPFQI